MIPREGIVSRRLLDTGVAEELFFEQGLIENVFEPLSRPMERQDFDASLPLKALRAAVNAGRAGAGFVRLLRRIRKERYDLIFCNGTSAGFLGGALAAATGVPAIWHVLYPSITPLIRPLHRRLAAGRNVRLIICVSKPTAPQFDHCREKVRAIQTELDTDKFDTRRIEPRLRQEFGLDGQPVIFGSHGCILPRKGFIELIRAARIVIDELSPEERGRCRFIILGDTPQDMRPDHLAECRVRSYVADFDVAVVPNVYEDPLPQAVMESMAMSKPVAAFAMGGIGEMIDEGVEGRLVSGRPPDIEGLAEACLAYFRDADLRRRHGAAARQRIERDFDARKHAHKLQDEMFRIVANR